MRPEDDGEERPTLAAVQGALMSMITGRPDGANRSTTAAALVMGDARASAEERIAVYAYMYRARIVEALESQFPRLAKHLGTDDFAALASRYIDDEPSRHPSLRLLGQRLPSWLGSHRSKEPMLAGLAGLEWARSDVFDLLDEPALTMDAVRAWPPERFGELPLRLLVAHRLVTASAGSSQLWDSLGTDGAALAPETSGTPTLGDDEVTEVILVWRQGNVVFHRRLAPSEQAALTLAATGTTFGVICDSLLQVHDEDAATRQAFTWMVSWLRDGLLTQPRHQLTRR